MKQKINIDSRFKVSTKKGVSWKKTAEKIYAELHENSQKEKENIKISKLLDDGTDIQLYAEAHPEIAQRLCQKILEIKEWADSDRLVKDLKDTFNICTSLEEDTVATEIVESFLKGASNTIDEGNYIAGEGVEAINHIREFLPREELDQLLKEYVKLDKKI